MIIDFQAVSASEFAKMTKDPHVFYLVTSNASLEAGLYDENDNLVYSWEELKTEIGGSYSGKQYPLITVANGELTTGFIAGNPPTQLSTTKLAGKLVVSDEVTSLSNNCFYKCSNLTSVELPNSVTTIGQSAFAQCTRLTNIVLPNQITSLVPLMFRFCTFTSIGPEGSGADFEIPSQITTIEQQAFQYNTSLTSVVLPDTVTNIGSYAFGNCKGLGGNVNYKRVTFGTGIEYIGDYIFNDDSMTNLVYTGSMEQWNTIVKSSNWYKTYNSTDRLKYVYCSDGTITIPVS